MGVINTEPGKTIKFHPTQIFQGTTSNTTGNFVLVPSLTITLTPVSTASKFHIFSSVSVSNTIGFMIYSRVTRGGTPILVGNAGGSRQQATSVNRSQASAAVVPIDIKGSDSPATASSITYEIEYRTEAGGVAGINRSRNDTDAVFSPRTISTLMIFEEL